MHAFEPIIEALLLSEYINRLFKCRKTLTSLFLRRRIKISYSVASQNYTVWDFEIKPGIHSFLTVF